MMDKSEREKLRKDWEDGHGLNAHQFNGLLDHIDMLERQIEELRDADLPDSLNVYFMHDGHWFTRIEGNTLDEMLSHADAIESGEDGAYGLLGQISLMRGKREIRRVGQLVHSRSSSAPKDEWNKGKAAWKAAAEADPDVQRILSKAAIASAQEVKK